MNSHQFLAKNWACPDFSYQKAGHIKVQSMFQDAKHDVVDDLKTSNVSKKNQQTQQILSRTSNNNYQKTFNYASNVENYKF
jgi:hypothetical protein